MKDSFKLFSFQLLAHSALVYLLFAGNVTAWIGVLAVYFIMGCFGITMTYHRLLSHRAWKAPPWWVYFGSLCGVYGLVGSPLAWVSTHRVHHKDTDGPTDPHSPKHKSWWKIQWFSMFEPVPIKYGVDMLRSPFHVWVHKHYFEIHYVLLAIWLLIDPFSAVVFYLAPAALLWNMGSCINTINHSFGYRNTNTKDNSTCNHFLGYFVFGEGWHNNHHADPANVSFQKKWWEFDIGYSIIKVVQKNN